MPPSSGCCAIRPETMIRTPSSVGHGVVHVEVSLGRILKVELCGPRARASAKSGGLIVISQDVEDGASERLGCVWLAEANRVARVLAYPSDVGRGDRDATAHGLEERVVRRRVRQRKCAHPGPLILGPQFEIVAWFQILEAGIVEPMLAIPLRADGDELRFGATIENQIDARGEEV